MARNDKGQVTLFVIIGIVIVGLVLAAFFLFRPEDTDTEAYNIPLEFRPVQNLVDDCITKSTLDALIVIGGNGGYILGNTSTSNTTYGNINLWYDEGMRTQPSKGSLVSNLTTYLPAAIASCVDFTSLPGYIVSTKTIVVDVEVQDQAVVVSVDYPLDILYADAQLSLEKFTRTIRIPLGRMYDAASGITEKTLQDPNTIDMSYLNSIPNLSASFIPLNRSDILFSIKANNTPTAEPYLFLIVQRYDRNSPPVITIPDTMLIDEGKPYLYQVTATDPDNDPLAYSDDTGLFDITEDGLIAFTAEVPGEYIVMIRAEDVAHNIDEKQVRFIVR